MFRRRRSGEVVLLDLGAPGVDGEPPRPGKARAHDEPALLPSAASRSHRTPAQARRQALAAGAVLVVGLGAWGATTAHANAAREARLATAPGGVLSLDRPPVEAWSADTDAADARLFLPGIVVVRDGVELVGLDAGNGAERWRAEVGGDPACGTNDWRRSAQTVDDRLACWSGPNADRSVVTVVDRDGLVATRDLGDGLAAVQPAADGTVVTVGREGPRLRALDLGVVADHSTGWRATGSIPEGPDALVRLEDGATGETLWERRVPFEPVADVTSCALWLYDSGSDAPTLDVTQLGLVVSDGLVELSACGLHAAFDGDGRPAVDPSASAWSSVEPYPDGGVLEHVGAYAADTGVTALLHRPDGVTETFTHELAVPWATDGVPSDVRLVAGRTRHLAALAPDGAELWTTRLVAPDVLVRAAGVLLVALADGTAAGIDLETGETLWTDQDLLRGDASAASWWGADAAVRAAFTDGERALLVVQPIEEQAAGDAGRTVRLVAVDLATGDVVWAQERRDHGTRLVAARGRLYLTDVTDSDGGVWLRDEGGETVRHVDGTVTALR